MRTAAIVLAGGSGSRMKSKEKKQYMLLGGRPVLWYSLRAMQDCAQVDEIVLVCGSGETEACRRRFVQEYGFSKITHITEGGKERWNSVYEGLKTLTDCDYVLIHDGARPFLDREILNRVFEALRSCPACAVGMPVKDTIKLAASDLTVEQTLPRDRLWMIQTPQAFSYPLIRSAYDELARRTAAEEMTAAAGNAQPVTPEAGFVESGVPQPDDAEENTAAAGSVQSTMRNPGAVENSVPQPNDAEENTAAAGSVQPTMRNPGAVENSAQQPSVQHVKITDDAMVAEYILGVKVQLVEGSYRNLKITTPEDLILAEALCANGYALS